MEDKLIADSILSAEFDYITRTAFQADEDRAKVTTLYLITVGSFLAAMLTVQLDIFGNQAAALAFAALFALLSGYAILSLLQLIRLRQAWHASAMAMNHIKKFYCDHLPEIPLKEAFAWNEGNLPPQYKPWSLSFLLVLQVALLGGASLGAAVLFFGIGLAGGMRSWMWIIALLVAIIYVADMIAAYWWLLRNQAN